MTSATRARPAGPAASRFLIVLSLTCHGPWGEDEPTLNRPPLSLPRLRASITAPTAEQRPSLRSRFRSQKAS